MTPELQFVAALAVTLVLLGGVVVTGLRKQRRRHLPLVALAVLSLGITIYFAERLGKHLDIHSAGLITPVHLMLAKVTTVLYLAPLTTGILTLRNGRHLGKHRVSAYGILVLTVLTAVTGTWMAMASERLDEPRTAASGQVDSTAAEAPQD